MTMVDSPSLKARLTEIALASGVLVLLAAFWLARELGALMNALAVFLFVSALILLTRRVVALARRKLSFEAYRQPRAHLPQLGAVLLRVLGALLFGWAVNTAFVPAQFSEREGTQFRTIIWVAAMIVALCSLVPRARRWAPSDVIFAVLFLLVSFDLWRGLSDPTESGALDLRSPFEQTAYVFHGGQSPLFNHHAPIAQQAGALDLLPLTVEGELANGDKRELNSYACFGAPLVSPVNGRVAHVLADRPDMPVGQTDLEVLTGNSISIETDDHRYVLLAHLQAGSVQVAVGEPVVMGQAIARCGNSGNTSMPHLHLQAQNRPVFSNEDPELRTFPLRFIQAERVRGGSVMPGPFSVRRNDAIRPLRDTTAR